MYAPGGEYNKNRMANKYVDRNGYAFLSIAIQNTIGGNIMIGLRCKTIGLAQRGQILKYQHVQSLHVEVPHAMKDTGTKAILQLYGRNCNTSYPNGVRSRFVLPS